MQTRKHDTAFPIYDSYGEPVDIEPGNIECLGLTKREYFAAMAMQGILASGSDFFQTATSLAVQLADDLILKLNKSSSNENQYSEEQPQNQEGIEAQTTRLPYSRKPKLL